MLFLIRLLALSLFSAVLASSCFAQSPNLEDASQVIPEEEALPAPAQSPPSPTDLESLVFGLYEEKGMTPYWLGTGGPSKRAEILLSTLRDSHLDGLHPADYRITAITALWNNRSIEGLARLDVLLSLGLAQYLSDLHLGRTNTLDALSRLTALSPQTPEDLALLIRQGLQTTNLEPFLAAQLPQHAAYRGLKTALARYRSLAEQGGWAAIDEGPTLKPGDRDPRLAEIARRLIMVGDLQSGVAVSILTYGEPLVSAVRQFQARFRRKATGIIDNQTIALMNLPAEHIISRILINMERWRWLPRELSGKRVIVNIAGFHLIGAEDEKPQIDMPVIVGDVYSETPVLSDLIRYIVFNPYWTIPPGIAERETLPRQIADPNYLRSKGIRVFESWREGAREIDPDIVNWATLGSGIRNFRLRQDPGPDNALGQMKFMFPNNLNIYLHDTPAHDLFSRSTRTFSHGCIRLSNPIGLAVYLLGDNSRQAMGKEQIQAIVDSGQHRVIHLQHPIPVHLIYQTVEADQENGRLQFYEDVYGRDEILAKTLFSKRDTQLMAAR